MKDSKKIWNGVKKKARRIKIRRSWSVNPKTMVKKSKKLYSRQKRKKETQNAAKTWSTQR